MASTTRAHLCGGDYLKPVRVSKESSTSVGYLSLSRSGVWGNVPVDAADLALIVNEFVRNRPQKNRGINIDVFVSKEWSFHDQATESGLRDVQNKFWITGVKTSRNGEEAHGEAMYILGFSEDFIVPERRMQAFILELNRWSFCLVTNLRRSLHRKLSDNLRMRLYPKSTRAFLTSSEMFRIIDSADQRREYDLRVKFNSASDSDRVGEIALEFHGRPREKKPTVREIYRESRNLRRSLTMWRLTAADMRHPFEITFSGEGHIGLYDGTFDDIVDDFLFPTAKVSLNRVRKFSGRSMSETSDRKAKSVEIVFESEQFRNADEMKSLIDHVKEYPHCSYSIIHPGNPHLYMYFMDLKERSTFSLRTIGTNKIVISPQIVTSAESIARFADYILTLPKLGGGEIAQDG